MRKLLIGTLLLAGIAAPAQAELSYTPIKTEGGVNFVVVSGNFEANEDFRPFVELVDRTGATVVSFDSSGGNVYSALRFGRLIRLMGLHTYQTRKLECASACAYAFLGGHIRLAEPGTIGVHQTHFSDDVQIDRADAVSGIQASAADLLDYLKEMGVSSDLLSFSFRYASDDIRYLSASEMRSMGVTTDGGDQASASASMEAASPKKSTTVSKDSKRDDTAEVEYVAVQYVTAIIEEGVEPEEIPEYFAPVVNYYGERRTLPEVIADKKAFMLRWPNRSYRVQPSSVSSECNQSLCRVTGLYDFHVHSDARNKTSSGTAGFSYVIDRKTGHIIEEDGKVMPGFNARR